MKRTIVVVALLAVAILSPTAWAKSYDHPLIDITFRLQPDGSADVTEIRAFRFDGPFTWAEIERGTLNNPGRARFLYQELMSRRLPPEVERITRERMRVAEDAVARQRGPS